MPLIPCPDCSTEVSDRAPACPKCGRPIAPPVPPPPPAASPYASVAAAFAPVAAPQVVNKGGAFCPNCKNRDSYRTTNGMGCVFWIFVLLSMGIALVMIPFLPKTWHCRACGNQWRA